MTTSNAITLSQESYNRLIPALGRVFKAALETEASPQDAIEVIDEVVNELTALRQAIPGGSEESQESVPPQEAEEEEEAEESSEEQPPGKKKEPVTQGASLQSDSAEESREKVNEQNAAQISLKNKTYTAKDIESLETQLLSAKTKVGELEAYQNQREVEYLAKEYSELFDEPVQQAKFEEVINSGDSVDTIKTKIAAISEFRGNSVKPAKSTNTWVSPQKNAKLIRKTRIGHL